MITNKKYLLGYLSRPRVPGWQGRLSVRVLLQGRWRLVREKGSEDQSLHFNIFVSSTGNFVYIILILLSFELQGIFKVANLNQFSKN
jgi:hypothetical protein